MSSPQSPAIGARRWLPFGLLLVANVLAWIGYHQWQQRGLVGALDVQRVTPDGEEIPSDRPVLCWRFNMDMEQSEDGLAPGAVAPVAAGRWVWTGPRTLNFVAEGELPKATPFTFTLLPDRLRSVQGAALAESHTSKVHTPGLQVQYVRQAAVGSPDGYVLELGFSDKVLPEEVASRLTLSRDGERVRHRVLGQAPGEVVRVAIEPEALGGAANPTLRAALKGGLKGTQGPIAMQETFEQDVELTTMLAATGIRAESPAEGQPSIELDINGEVDQAALKGVISIDPQVPFVLSGGWRGAQLHGDFVPGTRYQVKIAPPVLPEGDAKARTPRSGTLSVLVPDRTSRVWFANKGGYLGSAGSRSVMAHAVNVSEVKVSLWRVYDNNIVAWKMDQQRQHYWQDATQYGRPVKEKVIAVPAERNKRHDLRIALDELVQGEKLSDGVYRVLIEGRDGARDEEERHVRYVYGPYGYSRADTTVITLSDVGLTAKRTSEAVTVWALSLKGGTPAEGVRVRVYSNKAQLLGEGRTAADGLVRVANLRPAPEEKAAVVLADRADGSGLTWVELGTTWNLAGVEVGGDAYLRRGHEAFVYTERGVYRPGEPVHLRAIVRDAEMNKAAAFPVKWQLVRPDGQKWRAQAAMLDGDGAAQWKVQLPADVPTGEWSAELTLPDGNTRLGNVDFNVEEFVPNRLKAALSLSGESAATDGGTQQLMAGDEPVTATLQADYLFGRPAEGLPMSFSGSLNAVAFAPSQWEGWAFGDTARVLEGERGPGRVTAQAPGEADGQGSGFATADASGRAVWSLPLKEVRAGDAGGVQEQPMTDPWMRAIAPRRVVGAGPWRLVASADVREPGGRAVTAHASATIHARPWYVGVRLGNDGLQPGVEGEVSLACVRPDGSAAEVDTPVQWKLQRENWSNPLVFEDGRYRYAAKRKLDAVEGQEGRIEVRGGRGLLRVKVPAPGSYVLQVGPEGQEQAISTVAVNALGDSGWNDNISRENPERLQLSLTGVAADATTQPATRATSGPAVTQAKFKIGDTVGVLVRSPFPGTLLLTLEADEVLSTQVIEMRETAMVVPVTLTAACRPNAYITASVVRHVDPNVAWRIHRACGVMRFAVDPAERKLNLALDVPGEVRPDAPMKARVAVTDTEGRPVPNAAVTFAAVDEGILQLTDFVSPDPLASFYAWRVLGVESSDIYGMLMPELPKPDKPSSVGGDGMGGRYLSAVPLSASRSVSLVSEVLHTDANGRAEATFAVPAFSGALRVMAVGSSDIALGSASGNTAVRAPLMVQSSFPRFAAPGDRFDGTVTVFNNAASAAEVNVSIAIDGSVLTLADGATATRTISIKAGEQKTLSIALAAGNAAGRARVKVTAEAGTERAEESVEVPIRPAAPTISQGGFAAAEAGKPLDVVLGEAMMPGTRQVAVHVTPWPSLNLPDGLDYLERYPYGCAEQVISTCFPLVYLSDIGQRVAPGAFERERVAAKLQAGVYRLLAMQTADGGIAMWPGADDAWPWASVYALHMVVEAENAGYEVPADFREHLVRYARRLVGRVPEDGSMPAQAYACYALAIAGKPDRAAMSRLEELSRPVAGASADAAADRDEARLLLAMAQVAAGRRDLAAAMIPQTLPVPRPTRRLGGNVGSPVRDQAMLVNALLAANPDHPALPDLVQRLADSGRKGGWRSTQDCAFAVMAIGRYLRQAQTPVAFDSVELRANDELLGRAEKGQSIAWAGGDDLRQAQVVAAGAEAAKAYVSWIATGVPMATPADADHGIEVRREYRDLKGKPIALDSLRSGDLVRVELTIRTTAALENVVVEDLLPAGLEIENPRLSTAASLDPDEEEELDRKQPQFDTTRVEVRDDRFVAVGNISGAGLVRYAYLARAVTPGTYVIPPVRGECMYDISVNSISGGGGKMTVRPAGVPEKVVQ